MLILLRWVRKLERGDIRMMGLGHCFFFEDWFKKGIEGGWLLYGLKLVLYIPFWKIIVLELSFGNKLTLAIWVLIRVFSRIIKRFIRIIALVFIFTPWWRRWCPPLARMTDKRTVVYKYYLVVFGNGRGLHRCKRFFIVWFLISNVLQILFLQRLWRWWLNVVKKPLCT